MPVSRKLWSVAVAISLLGAFVAGPASAQDQTALVAVKSARVGVGGRCKAGFWALIALDLQAGPGGARGQLEIVVPDGDNVPAIYASDLDLAAGEQRSILQYAKIGPASAPITIQLRDGERIVWSHVLSALPERLLATQSLIVGLGPDLDLAQAAEAIRRSPELDFAAAQVQSAAELPDRWWGYEGVDAVVLATSDAQWMQSITAEQSAALALWVRLGGKLVLCVGSRGEAVLAEGSPWAVLAPGKLAEVSALRERSGLETFAGAELLWEDDALLRDRPLVTRLREIDGAVLVDEAGGAANRPLVVRGAHGLGEVTFVGLDLDHPGLAKWAGRPRLLANVLTGGQGRTEDEQIENRRSVGHLGFHDLVGQLRAALDQFPGVALVNFTTVSVLTLVYLLLIGPGDYLLLSRLNLPRHFTWATFTLVVLGFGIAAWYLGGQAHGSSMRLNQVEIVDIDAKSGVVRGTAWAHLYSPSTVRITAQPRVAASSAGGWLAWQGLPGESLGGLSSRQAALAKSDAYRVLSSDENAGVIDLPVPSASSKSLSIRWWGQTDAPIASSLTRNQFGALDGELANPLPIELTECIAVYEDRLYRLPKLRPGQAVNLSSMSPLHLEARLTERKIVGDKDISTRWEQDSFDIPRIVQIMMLHDAARGSRYTGLTHRYQPYIDLSGHLHLGRAVLIGRAAQPIVRLVNDKQPLVDRAHETTFTWYRVVFPVLTPSSTSQP